MIPISRPIIGEEEIAAVAEVLRSGQLAGGETVNSFESLFASCVGVPCAVATSSGTTALHAALWSLGLPPGTGVITTPFTFVASANSILYCGHTPVFCDIEEDTLNLSPEALLHILRTRDDRPGALVVVHLFGQPCRMDSLMAIAEKYGLKVIEDCAQSHGAAWQGQAAGSFGHLGVFSFYPTKNMTTGEGGMVVTKDPALAGKIRMFINHGSQARYCHELLGYNFRLTNIAAAIGIAQLQRLNGLNEARRRNAGILDRLLGGIPGVKTPYAALGAHHVYHQYTIRCRRRDELTGYLLRHGVGSAVHYPAPVHKQPLYEKLGYGRVSLPVAEKACAEVLSLPVHPSLSAEDLQYIGQKAGDFYAAKNFGGHNHP